MGLFKNRPSYTPLSMPSLNSFAIPDLRVMKRDSAMINKITEVAMTNLGNADLGQIAPTAALLEQQLVGLFSGGDKSVLPKLGPAVAAGVQVGYMIAILENNSGVAKHDQAEGHYWTALVVMAMQLVKEFPEEYWQPSNFGFYAGYYVGRKGDIAIHDLLRSLQRELPAACSDHQA